MTAFAAPSENRPAIVYCQAARVAPNVRHHVVTPQPELLRQYRSRSINLYKGQELLMKEAFRMPRELYSTTLGLGDVVQTILTERGATVEQLLEDNIFKWFPIVETCYMEDYHPFHMDKPAFYTPLLHLAILLITTPPAKDDKNRPPCLPTITSNLYRTVKAVYATASAGLMPHVHLVQTLGLVALYEFGQGHFEQAHLTLNSAFAMANVVGIIGTEVSLHWLQCLMILDRMLALSSRSRAYHQLVGLRDVSKLRLACPSSHALGKEVDWILKDMNMPYYRVKSEVRVQKLLTMGDDIMRAGRVLQNIPKPCSNDCGSGGEDFSDDELEDDASGEARIDINKEFADMTHNRGLVRKAESWLDYESQALLTLSAILVYDYDPGRFTSSKPDKPGLHERQEECHALALNLGKQVVALHKRKDFDIEQLSLIDMFCVMHSMAMMVRDPCDNFAHKVAIALRPALKRYSLRWPLAVDYVFHITNYIEIENHLTEKVSSPRVPYTIKRNPNPVIRGRLLVAAAFIMEWVRFIREIAWSNAGFASLRKIRTYLEDYEPRYDPTVVPLALSEAEAKERGERAQISALQQENTQRTLNKSGFYSVADYRDLYLSGELTPVDVVRAILPLVHLDGPQPGRHADAWRAIKIDEIMKAARASTERYKNKKPLGPLDGVPSAIKDDYDLDGYSTTLGSPREYAKIPAEGASSTSWIVRKLEEAGVVIIGKLAMHEYGLDTTGNNPNHGTPRNPFNSGYYTGGSSSGPAYAVGAGLIPLALGSDGGGSIRIPGSFCSVFGLKPTHERLTSWPGANHSPTCAVQGPLAVDMRSLAAAYEAIAEPHPSTQFPPLALQPSPPVTKVLGIFDAWISRAEPGVQSLVRGMVESLAAKHGYTLVPISLPFAAEGQMAHALTVLTDASTLLFDTSGLTPANKILLALGRTTPATDYLLAQKFRGMLMQHLAYLWKTYPGMLIITPTTACAGAPIRGGKAELYYGVNDGNYTLQSMEYVWLANFCGLPAITVPAGYVVPEGSKEAGEVAEGDIEGKIPVGLMATGEWCSEDALLQFGFDAEAAGQDLRCKPPIWEDVISRAKDVHGNAMSGIVTEYC
ncbi:hypothetical protein FGRMN_6903 [Fusarium graminum]|nr:hypothetical protein FGRMN_6903 [Fusarium graminum]